MTKIVERREQITDSAHMEVEESRHQTQQTADIRCRRQHTGDTRQQTKHVETQVSVRQQAADGRRQETRAESRLAQKKKVDRKSTDVQTRADGDEGNGRNKGRKADEGRRVCLKIYFRSFSRLS
jgi:hypothetical protein